MKSSKLFLDEAFDMTQNRPLWRLISRCLALHAPSGTLQERR